MLNKEKHMLIMGRILKDIYTDVSLSPLLGFKGGTCAHFFYGLPRFSVDLDFDFLSADAAAQKEAYGKLLKILEQYGKIKDKFIKRNTLFMLLSYGEDDHNVKVEINVRPSSKGFGKHYGLRKYLGISVLAASKEYLFAGKLAALGLRKIIAARDIYDVFYFAKNNWDIDSETIEILTGKKTKEYLEDCVAVVEKMKDNRILHGLGELLDGKEKAWVKKHLKTETLFMLKNYLSSVSSCSSPGAKQFY